MKPVKLFEAFLNERDAVLGRGRRSVRVDFNDKRDMMWNIQAIKGDIDLGLVILVATEYKQGQPLWWKLATIQDGEIRFQESDLGEIPEWAKKRAHKEAKRIGSFKNLKEVSESVVNEGIGFDSALYKKVLKAIAATKTYLDIENEGDMNNIFLSTREHGDVGDETPGSEDIKEVQRVQKILQKKFAKDDIKIMASTTDEWVNLHIQKLKPIEYEYVFYRYKPGKTDRMSRRGMRSFKNFDDMIDALEDPYVSDTSAMTELKGIDWKAIKKEVDNITDFKDYTFTGWYDPKNPILLARTGEFGNKSDDDIYVGRIKSEQ